MNLKVVRRVTGACGRPGDALLLPIGKALKVWQLAGQARSPKSAVPMRTCVAPSAMAAS